MDELTDDIALREAGAGTKDTQCDGKSTPTGAAEIPRNF